MRHACRRCDWRPDRYDDLPPRTQLAEHATDSGHPLCVVCGLSLERQEQQTCTECVAQTRADLARVLELYAMLPGELGHATAAAPDEVVTRTGDTPIPGGDALVMLGPGSHGHGPDNLPSDPPAVAFELSRWEDDWRATRREPAAQSGASVSGAVAYLSPNTGWAGMYHPAFDEFAADVRGLVRRLRDTLGASERPQVGAPCFDCGADLQREYGQEHYTCPRCRRTYTDAEYWLAVRAEMERQAG